MQKPSWLNDYKSLNKLIILNEFIRQEFMPVSWIRLLTVALVGLFFSCAVLEVDLGDIGDDFGDEYDTYVHTTPIQSPNPTAVDSQETLLENQAIAPHQHPLIWPTNWFIVLFLQFFASLIHRRLKRRRPQVLHAVWRL
ncbi:hypothetical protein [Spirosoma gilvum]